MYIYTNIYIYAYMHIYTYTYIHSIASPWIDQLQGGWEGDSYFFSFSHFFYFVQLSWAIAKTSRNEQTMAADYDAIMLWLEDRGLESDRMVVFANSLGSLPAGPAAAGGSRIPIEKLVLEVPQSSANVIMQNSTGLSLPSSMITEYNFDIGKNMEDYTEQLLWMHGALDDVAPLETAMGAVQRHNGSYYREEVYQDAGHGLRWDIGTEEWSRVLHEFILH